MVYFQTQNPNLRKFGRGLSLEIVYILYGHLHYVTDIWDIKRPFGTFFPVLVSRTKRNLATL
jgi:hypothetical protein